MPPIWEILVFVVIVGAAAMAFDCGGCDGDSRVKRDPTPFSCAPPTYAVSLGTVVCCAQDIDLLGGRERTVIQGCESP